MYRRSSFCKADTPMCVEVAGLATNTITVRSSVSGHTVTFTRVEWAAFLRGVQSGEFALQGTDGSAPVRSDPSRPLTAQLPASGP